MRLLFILMFIGVVMSGFYFLADGAFEVNAAMNSVYDVIDLASK